MFRRPWFWVVFTLASALCTFWAVRHFAEAFPLVTLDVTMDRSAALDAADALATDRGFGPEDARQAVQFSLDNETQSFVELEAGGKEAYNEMLRGDLYSPYLWIVRRFAEGEANETVVRFRPDGTASGFRETLPEDEPGASLEAGAARKLAEAAVADGWDVDLGGYELVESSYELRPGGRTDHTLVYERPDVQIGEGRYRLRLTVAGDRFAELTHFIKIPEAFTRRYQEMRSANQGIATGALYAVAILYLGGGCAVGLFFLMRQRWVVWKPALKWAVFIAALQALVVLNQWPLLWMGYDTALSATTFALQQIAVALAQLVGMGAVLALSFIAAESLTRRAFPEHIQLWRAWSAGVAPTRSLLGQTVAGYLMIGIFFAYEVWLYVFANNNLEWWTPSSALTDPDVLANYFPWLTSIAVSLQAGFWEECLFRAVPIASAALLGRRFGMRWLWIAAALVLQAVIFGAGHANYPAQPAYARLVELIIPALSFGGIYLVFGLVPAIIFHFAYDVVWFALPLFTAATPGVWVDRGIIIALTLVPLWVVLRARWRAGSWGEVSVANRNISWTPPPAPERTVDAPIAASERLPTTTRTALVILGVVGLVVWGLTSSFRTEAPGLEHTDAEARFAARAARAARGVELAPEWRELSDADAPLGLADRFVWQEGGREAYRDLLGRYLPVPRRIVRYARFDGDVAERAEEYVVFVGPDGEIQRLTHVLPEDRPGAQLEEDEARVIALQAVREIIGRGGETLEEVSADPSQHPGRRDWSFVFRDPAGYPMAAGEARIEINIAGDEVVRTGRYVHIPEEWERADRNRRGTTQIVQIACVVLLVLLYLAGAVLAVVWWSRRRFATATFAVFFAVLAALGVIRFGNGFRAASSQFLTEQPFKLQAALLVIGGLIAMTAVAAVSALLIGLAHRMLPPQPPTTTASGLAAGFGLGAALAALGAAGMRLAPSELPQWPDLAGAADWLPVLAASLGPLRSWLTGTALILLAVTGLHTLTGGWQRRRVLASVLLVGLGLVATGSGGVESLPLWLVEGALTGLVLLAAWALVLRHQPALVPLVTAAGAALGTVRNAVIGGYPGATAGSTVGAVLMVAIAVWWYNRLSTDTAVMAPLAASAASSTPAAQMEE
jgi:hypothetical protein